MSNNQTSHDYGLTPDQTAALGIIMRGHNVFLTGIPGSGKTFLINHMLAACKNKRIAITATTGIAATNITSHTPSESGDSRTRSIKGTTIHHFSGGGLFNLELPKLVAKVARNRPCKKRWIDTQILVIDEVSMLPAHILDALDHIARAIRRIDAPFGGIQLVLVGDFNQIEPIANAGQFEVKYAFEAESWRYITHKFRLTTNMRQDKDATYRRILTNIRSNNLTEDDKAIVKARIGVCPPPEAPYINIYTHNIDVDRINNDELKRLDASEYHIYASKTAVTALGRNKITKEYIEKNVMCQTELKLCIGCRVMLLINLDTSIGLVNGALGRVDSFTNVSGKHYPIVEFGADRHTVMPYTWKFEEDEQVLGELVQVPLKLAYAATVHKTQGMTFERASMDLTRVFAHGMLYTALSRVKSLDGLYLKGINWNNTRLCAKIKDFDASI
jgi:ATP-dependent DNA helicase PIF1